LNEVTLEVNSLYEQFRLSEALKRIYSLIWDDFCSWYLEWIKPGMDQSIDPNLYAKTTGYFKHLVQLLHPFMPFVTEEIYHILDEKVKEDLCVTQFTPPGTVNEKVLMLGELLKETITAIRDARNKNSIKPKDPIQLYIQTPDASAFGSIQDYLKKQVNADIIEFGDAPAGNSISVVVGVHRFFIVTEKAIDVTAQREQLLKELDYQKGFLISVEKKLSNERFVSNAKPEVVEIERKKKSDAEQKIKTLEESIRELQH